MDNNNMQQPEQQYQQQYQQPGQKPGNGLAVASLILGIVALVCIFLGTFAFVGVISGIVGLILGIMSKKQAPSGMATAGIILSCVGLGLCVISFVACIICVGSLAGLSAYY